MTWAVEQVIKCAGIRLEDADEYIKTLAQRCLDECYYISAAADRLLYLLQTRKF